MPWDQLLGPWGLVVAALIAVAVLWRSHVKEDERQRIDADAWKALVQLLVPKIDGLGGGMEKLTTAVTDMDKRRPDVQAIAKAVAAAVRSK